VTAKRNSTVELEEDREICDHRFHNYKGVNDYVYNGEIYEVMELRQVRFYSKLCVTCHSCENACAVKHSDTSSVSEAAERGLRLFPRIRITERKGKPKMVKCVFCKKPKCVEACPEKAIVQGEDGYVFIDDAKCDGCGSCISACPFEAIQMTGEGKSVKCDLCLDDEIPACVYQCPVEALVVVD